MPPPPPPAGPADLTPAAVTNLLRSCPHYDLPMKTRSVASLSVRDVEEGVLSRVVSVSLTYATTTTGSTCVEGGEEGCAGSSLPTGLVVKFVRPASPQLRMFQTEGAFYSPTAKYTALRSSLPVSIPICIHASSHCIVLERIDVSGGEGGQEGRDGKGGHRKLVDGCREGRELDGLVRVLATIHATCWVGCGDGEETAETAAERYADLDPTPGVGMAMSGLDKERLFTDRWGEYVDALVSNGIITAGDEHREEKMRDVCQRLAKVRLREIHDRVASFRPTLIHGDFHVANLLFPADNDTCSTNGDGDGDGDANTDDDDNNKQQHTAAPFLIDWATCGAGNPLFDLTFFLLVSTPHGGEDTVDTERLLRLYHATLTDPSVSENAGIISKDLPYAAFLDMYRTCVLNEFLILVAYDRLAQQFVQGAETPAKRDERAKHFGNVARRCAGAVLSDLVDVEKYELPGMKTVQDVKEEVEALEGSDNNLGMEL